jgi:hypothetical protein
LKYICSLRSYTSKKPNLIWCITLNLLPFVSLVRLFLVLMAVTHRLSPSAWFSEVDWFSLSTTNYGEIDMPQYM